MSKLNIKWFINGVIADAPDATALRALVPGDAAVVVSGCTKADPFAIMFGDKPMYPEFDPTDRNNAALNLRDLELAFPCHRSVGGPLRSSAAMIVARQCRMKSPTCYFTPPASCALNLR